MSAVPAYLRTALRALLVSNSKAHLTATVKAEFGVSSKSPANALRMTRDSAQTGTHHIKARTETNLSVGNRAFTALSRADPKEIVTAARPATSKRNLSYTGRYTDRYYRSITLTITLTITPAQYLTYARWALPRGYPPATPRVTPREAGR
jgi:hypothetical protein